jgi:glycine/D-amino acid oxidase-like deaminating enzyme
VILIIGAGVCGLSAADELSRRGEAAIVLERGQPFSEQSAGLARIFRIAAFVGSNLMKSGPLLGEWLAEAVLKDELSEGLIIA